MFLEEKLDLLKSKLSPDDLVIRYNDFKQIMTKIESIFLYDDLNNKYSGWSERLKGFKEYSIENSAFNFIRSKLIEDKKYWWVFVEGTYPSSRHRVFDATIKGGEALSNIFSDSPLYIVDKKYK